MEQAFYKSGKPFLIFLLQTIASAFALFGLVLYFFTGKNAFSPDLSISLMITAGLFVVSQVAEILLFMFIKEKNVKPIMQLCQFIVAIVGMLAFAFFITNNINYLASIVAAIDGTPLTAAFIFTAVLLFGAFISSFVAANIAVSVERGGESNE